jgi:hypothetical protein
VSGLGPTFDLVSAAGTDQQKKQDFAAVLPEISITDFYSGSVIPNERSLMRYVFAGLTAILFLGVDFENPLKMFPTGFYRRTTP